MVASVDLDQTLIEVVQTHGWINGALCISCTSATNIFKKGFKKNLCCNFYTFCNSAFKVLQTFMRDVISPEESSFIKCLCLSVCICQRTCLLLFVLKYNFGIISL